MRFYSDMFRGFSALLPGQWDDPLGRSASLFAAAWVGWLVLIDAGLLGVMASASCGVLAASLLALWAALYVAHLLCFRYPGGGNEDLDSAAEPREISGIATAYGLLFVLLGGCSGIGTAMLSR
ncbi:MAG TPA: hypothetical protein VK876_12505 [Rubrivivax sp.]|nr:hypothetical protein [Rubrivivax sp.]